MPHKTRLSVENLIYIVLWIALFVSPIAGEYFKMTSQSHLLFQWSEVYHTWTVFAFYLLIFLFHDLVLAPLLIYKRKKALYLVITLCLLSVFTFFQCIHQQDVAPIGQPPAEAMRQIPDRPEPRHHDFRPMPPDNGKAPAPRPAVKPDRKPMPLGPEPVINVMILLGILGLNLGIKLYFKSEKDRADMLRMEGEKLYQQLEYLKYQINPHFLMNTLNNIQVLVDIDPEQAKAAVRQLSVMMRFVLYEADKNFVPLQKETEFLSNYIKLMSLRYTDRLSVSFDIPDNLPNVQVPPLILVTFVENSFKHGADPQGDSFINITMDAEDNTLLFFCVNSKRKDKTGPSALPHEGGVGLKNVVKRLDLIYGEDYSLDISDKPDTYSVQLRLPFKHKNLIKTSL